MAIHQIKISVSTEGAGPYEITDELNRELKRSRLKQGIVTVFCQHTSCSLVTMENADPSAWHDLKGWLDRLVPDDDPNFQHTFEGPDDMPSHIKMALTRSSENVPFAEGRFLLGTWQGLFLWEHRRSPHNRNLVLTFIGE